MEEQSFDAMKKAVSSFLPQIYQDVAHPSLEVIGKSLGNILDFVCIPFTSLGIINERVRLTLLNNLEKYRKKLESVSEDKRCEVHPQLGVPVLEHLRYTTNDDIADLFINLLANGSSVENVHLAHPSFVSIIEKFSADEAKIVQYLSSHKEVEYCEFMAFQSAEKGYISIRPSHMTILKKEVELEWPENEDAYWANLMSCGIVEDMKDVRKVDPTVTEQIKEFWNYDYMVNKYVPSVAAEIRVRRSYIRVTELGHMFINACTKS